MTRLRLRLAAALLTAAPLLLGATDTRAAGAGLDGPFTCVVDFGPVLLDGRYPFTVAADAPGKIDVATSPTGAVTARVSLFGSTENVVGKLASSNSAVKLTLRGKVAEGGIAIAAALQGNAFVGTIKFRGKTAPCRIDLSNVGPIRARYALTLATSAKGAVTGAGTLGVGGQKVNVLVRGSLKKGRVTLAVQGGATVLKLTNGAIAAGAVSGPTWTAKGFGAAFKGTRRLTLAPG